jgi:hypothetical protein
MSKINIVSAHHEVYMGNGSKTPQFYTLELNMSSVIQLAIQPLYRLAKSPKVNANMLKERKITTSVGN